MIFLLPLISMSSVSSLVLKDLFKPIIDPFMKLVPEEIKPLVPLMSCGMVFMMFFLLILR